MKEKRVYLRALDVSDFERTYRWHNDPQMYETLAGQFRYVSRSAEEEWVHKRAEFSNNEVNCAVCLIENDEHIGYVFNRSIDWINRTSRGGGLMIDPKYQGKGIVLEVFLLYFHHLFKDLGLVRNEVYTLTDNEAIIKAQEKMNVKREGRLRKACYKNGEFVDLYLYAMLDSDYDELVARLEREEAEKEEGKSS